MPNKTLQVVFRVCFMISIPLVTLIHISLNRFTPGVHNISTVLDDIIPFIAVFSLPYMFWFVYLPGVLIYFAVVDGKTYFRLLASIITGMCLCFVVFYLFPTTVPRPGVVGDDVSSRLVRYIYSTDNPYNCFPSIHVLDAFLPSLFLWLHTKNKIVRAFAAVSFISITLSTLFIKQHFVLDAPSAVLVGIAVYLLVTSENLWNRLPVKRVIDFIIPLRFKGDYSNTD